jgi:hypothetical protein
VHLGEQGGVTLIGDDGNVRARVIGGVANGMGSTLASNSRLASLPHTDRAGSLVLTSRLDQVERVPPSTAWPTTRCACSC